MRATRAARWLVLAPALCAPALLAGCGATGSKSSGSEHTTACAYVAKLDDIAAGVARADVHDPVEFKKTLDTAVHDYVANVKSLREVAPNGLSTSLDRVESDVQQYRFDAALTDRSELDAYAARNCGRVAKAPTSTSGPATTSSLPESSTTAAVDPTSTALTAGG
jgi:hypothetical protein